MGERPEKKGLLGRPRRKGECKLDSLVSEIETIGMLIDKAVKLKVL
jgi:hypothetical protein